VEGDQPDATNWKDVWTQVDEYKECKETSTMFGDVEVAHAWLWCTEKNPQPYNLPEKTWLDSLSSEEIFVHYRGWTGRILHLAVDEGGGAKYLQLCPVGDPLQLLQGKMDVYGFWLEKNQNSATLLCQPLLVGGQQGDHHPEH
jgi:hypothetical protein